MEEIRLQKYIAKSGVASRRKAEELILEGKIQVNGKTITELGTKVNPEKDIVTYNGRKLKTEEEFVYILLNKPIGYVTTVKDQFGRDSVLDLVNTFERVNNIKVPYVIAPRRPGDIASCYSDPTKALKELGWSAEKNLDDMCKDSWNFQVKNM